MIYELLQQRKDDPIRVGIVGGGKFGTGVVAQIAGMTGMRVCAIADVHVETAHKAYDGGGHGTDEVVVVSTADALEDAIASGKRVVTEDALLLARADGIDVLMESTGIPDVGARVAHEAITHNTHVVMVNVEADVTVGPYLRRLADAAGVVYTAVDGDQPGCTMNMVEWARSLGFEIVAAGRGTIMYDTDREGLPETVPARFAFTEEMVERRRINFKMYNSFRDGTKAQVEMTALANMTGLPPDVRGMHEPSVNVEDIARVLSLADEGGILSRAGCVELANSVADDGKTMLPTGLGMGVFVVIRTEHPFIQEDLAGYIGVVGGNGKNFLLHRPYHLVAVEAPISIASAALFGMPTGSPLREPVAEVVTVAKRELKAGETIDGGGGSTVNGLIEKAGVARDQELLPLGLSAGAVLTSDVGKGTAIGYGDVTMSSDSFVAQIRKMQDAVSGQG